MLRSVIYAKTDGHIGQRIHQGDNKVMGEFDHAERLRRAWSETT